MRSYGKVPEPAQLQPLRSKRNLCICQELFCHCAALLISGAGARSDRWPRRETIGNGCNLPRGESSFSLIRERLTSWLRCPFLSKQALGSWRRRGRSSAGMPALSESPRDGPRDIAYWIIDLQTIFWVGWGGGGWDGSYGGGGGSGRGGRV